MQIVYNTHIMNHFKWNLIINYYQESIGVREVKL